VEAVGLGGLTHIFVVGVQFAVAPLQAGVAPLQILHFVLEVGAALLQFVRRFGFLDASRLCALNGLLLLLDLEEGLRQVRLEDFSAGVETPEHLIADL
jgi:hypothetical protein